MTAPDQPPYRISGRALVTDGDGLRVQVMTLAAGERIPWHFHNEVADSFVGLDGVTVVETRAPRARHELGPGEHCTVGPKTAHEVTGKDGGPCRFVLIQGVGAHDFNPVR
jgi:quercetin dioxygenase-like cupin family protein